MAELGLTPAARTWLPLRDLTGDDQTLKIQFVTMVPGEDGTGRSSRLARGTSRRSETGVDCERADPVDLSEFV